MTKKEIIKKTPDSMLYCQFTKQNSIFTTDLKGQVKITLSNGMTGFKNSKKKEIYTYKYIYKYNCKYIGRCKCDRKKSGYCEAE